MKDTKPKKPDPSRQNIQTNPKYGENSVIFQLKENHIASQPVAISCILIPWFPEYQTHLQTMHEAKDLQCQQDLPPDQPNMPTVMGFYSCGWHIKFQNKVTFLLNLVVSYRLGQMQPSQMAINSFMLKDFATHGACKAKDDGGCTVPNQTPHAYHPWISKELQSNLSLEVPIRGRTILGGVLALLQRNQPPPTSIAL